MATHAATHAPMDASTPTDLPKLVSDLEAFVLGAINSSGPPSDLSALATGAANSLIDDGAFMSTIQKAERIVESIRARGESHDLLGQTHEEFITRLLNRGHHAPQGCPNLVEKYAKLPSYQHTLDYRILKLLSTDSLYPPPSLISAAFTIRDSITQATLAQLQAAAAALDTPPPPAPEAVAAELATLRAQVASLQAARRAPEEDENDDQAARGAPEEDENDDQAARGAPEEDENDDEESGEEGSDEDVEEDEMEVTRGKSTGGKKVQEDGPMVEGYATTVVKSVSYSADVESDVGTLSFAVEDVHILGFGAPRSGLLETHPDQQAKNLLLEKPIVLFPTKGNCGVAWTLGAVHVVQGKEKIIGLFRNGACDVSGKVSRKAAEHLGIKVGLFEKNMKPVAKQTNKSNVKYGDDRDAVVDLCKLISSWFKELESYHQQGHHFFDTWAEACTQGRITDWSKVTKSPVFCKEEFVFTGPNRDGKKNVMYPTELFVQWATQHFRSPALLPA